MTAAFHLSPPCTPQRPSEPDIHPLVTSHRDAEPVLVHPLGLTLCSDIVNSVRHAVALIRANNVAASEGLNPTTPTKLGDGIGMSR